MNGRHMRGLDSHPSDRKARHVRTMFTLAAAVLLTAGCGSNDPTPAPASITTPAASTSSATPTATTSTPTSAPEPAAAPPSPEVAPPAAAPATFVRCHLADGTALLSDGTTTYMDTCNESAGGPLLLEDGTSIYDNHPELTQPTATYPGWHCDGPAYLCRDDNASGKTAGQ